MIHVGIVIFPQVEELDFVAPFEVLSYINKIRPHSTKISLIAPSLDVVHAFNGLKVIPDATLESVGQLDVVVFPGGKGRATWMRESCMLNFIHKQKDRARYITSVCTGAFFLANAGLLCHKKATTHQSAFEELSTYDVNVLDQKVVHEGNIITAGGVSSGVELGLYLLRELFGTDLAQEVAQKIEYALDVRSL